MTLYMEQWLWLLGGIMVLASVLLASMLILRAAGVREKRA